MQQQLLKSFDLLPQMTATSALLTIIAPTSRKLARLVCDRHIGEGPDEGESIGITRCGRQVPNNIFASSRN